MKVYFNHHLYIKVKHLSVKTNIKFENAQNVKGHISEWTNQSNSTLGGHIK